MNGSGNPLQKPTHVHAPQMAGAVTRVLCVDDECLVRELLAFLIGRHFSNAVFLGVADGVSAAELVETQPMQLCIVDYRMPGMDGIELIAAIRAHQPHVPIILWSAQPGITDIGRTAGATIVLQKPVEIDALVAMLQRFLD